MIHIAHKAEKAKTHTAHSSASIGYERRVSEVQLTSHTSEGPYEYSYPSIRSPLLLFQVDSSKQSNSCSNCSSLKETVGASAQPCHKSQSQSPMNPRSLTLFPGCRYRMIKPSKSLGRAKAISGCRRRRKDALGGRCRRKERITK